MSFRTFLVAVLLAQGFLNFVEGNASFRRGLAFPKHHESLPANSAMGFGISAGALAQNLHIPASSPVNFSDSRN
jgi:hypothetical protein